MAKAAGKGSERIPGSVLSLSRNGYGRAFGPGGVLGRHSHGPGSAIVGLGMAVCAFLDQRYAPLAVSRRPAGVLSDPESVARGLPRPSLVVLHYGLPDTQFTVWNVCRQGCFVGAASSS